MDIVKEIDVSTLSLSDLKNYRYNEIDKRTGELIKLGFVFASKTFSLSKTAQLNLLGINSSKDNISLAYPIKYNTIDDLDSHELIDSTTVSNFYLTALSTKRSHIDSGTDLKTLVRNAVDIVAVNTIIDVR